MQAKDDELLTNFGATRLELVSTGGYWAALGGAGRRWAALGTAGHCWAPLGTAGLIWANLATCRWEPLTMLNPHFVAGEHGLFGAHKPNIIM